MEQNDGNKPEQARTNIMQLTANNPTCLIKRYIRKLKI